MITWNSLPDIFKCYLFNVQEQGTNFLSGKILENTDAGATMIAFFFLNSSSCGFSSVTVFGSGCFAVKFSIISFVVIIRIIRNVIVS